MNIYKILFNSLYARIHDINKKNPEIATNIFFSLLINFNINCIIYYLSKSTFLIDNKNYNFLLFLIIVGINHFYFINGKNFKKDLKSIKFKAIGYSYIFISFLTLFIMLDIGLYYSSIFFVLFLIIELIFEFSRY